MNCKFEIQFEIPREKGRSGMLDEEDKMYAAMRVYDALEAADIKNIRIIHLLADFIMDKQVRKLIV